VAGSVRHRRRGVPAYLTLIALVAISLLVLIPFVFVLINAVKPAAQYSAHGPLSLPDGFDTSGIKTFWNTTDFGRALWNSAVISGSVCVLAVLLSILNAYSLGIGRIRGRTWILGAFLIANFLPQEGLVYPLYYLAKRVGLYDTRLSVVIIFTVIQAAFGTGAGGARHAPGAAHHEPADHQRGRAARHRPHGRLLPDLPAHADPWHHGRCRQIAC